MLFLVVCVQCECESQPLVPSRGRICRSGWNYSYAVHQLHVNANIRSSSSPIPLKLCHPLASPALFLSRFLSPNSVNQLYCQTFPWPGSIASRAHKGRQRDDTRSALVWRWRLQLLGLLAGACADDEFALCFQTGVRFDVSVLI